MLPVSNFPFLTDSEFQDGCIKLVQLFDQARTPDQWEFVNFGEHRPKYLRVQRAIRLPRQSPGHPGIHSSTTTEEIEEEEDEAALRLPPLEDCKKWIEFHIFLSPTYRVPVLYICAQGLQGKGTLGIDTIYEWLVPGNFKSQMSGVGIIGAISMTNHPISDIPVFFIHPCNTAEALENSVQERVMSPDHYLQLWIGLVGSCINLHIPSAVALQSSALATEYEGSITGS